MPGVDTSAAQRLLADLESRVLAALAAIPVANEQVAVARQEQAVKFLQDAQEAHGRRRPGSTRQLERALTNPSTRTVTENGYRIIDPVQMDRLAPYWRVVNDGTRANIGRRIYGVFTGPGGGATNPMAERYGMDSRFQPTQAGGRGVIRKPQPDYRYVDEVRAYDNQHARKDVADALERLFRSPGINLPRPNL